MAEASAPAAHVTSEDGTRIGFRRSGDGPPLVLVHGKTGAHWSFRFLVPELAARFTVYVLDRRGRGASGDSAEYAIEREFEDVAAIADSIPGPVGLFGHSSGATVALGATLLTANLRGLVLYEASPGLDVVPGEDLDRIEALVARDERDEALTQALLLFGLTSEEVGQLRASPTWPDRVAAAHTVPREVRAEAAYRLDSERFGELAVPTLLLLGEESPDWAREATEQLAALLRDARVAILPGQGHMATMTAPALVAEEVGRFLGG